jgi:hypothetical protein
MYRDAWENAHNNECTRLDIGFKANSKPLSLDILVGKTGRKLLQAQLNLICAACLPPTLVDYAEWKKVSAIANA